MRLDKYLKVSRLIKRRTVANEVCDAGNVQVNGRPVRASYAVAVGDVISVKMGPREIKAEVLTVDETAGKADSRDMYKLL